MSDYSTNTSVNLMVNGQQAADTLANLKKHALDLSEQIAKAAAAGDKLTLQKLRKELRENSGTPEELRKNSGTPEELRNSNILYILHKEI